LVNLDPLRGLCRRGSSAGRARPEIRAAPRGRPGPTGGGRRLVEGRVEEPQLALAVSDAVLPYPVLLIRMVRSHATSGARPHARLAGNVSSSETVTQDEERRPAPRQPAAPLNDPVSPRDRLLGQAADDARGFSSRVLAASDLTSSWDSRSSAVALFTSAVSRAHRCVRRRGAGSRGRTSTAFGYHLARAARNPRAPSGGTWASGRGDL
jgi:hypothetical protein